MAGRRSITRSQTAASASKAGPRQSQALIACVIDDGHRLAAELERQAIDRGLEAWDLAVELRRRHRLRPIDPVWNYAGDLRARRAGRRDQPMEQLSA